jgi:hypothetical protein
LAAEVVELPDGSTVPTTTEPAPLIEIHVTNELGGVSEQRLLLRADSDDVLERALSRLAEGMARERQTLAWDEQQRDWINPEDT